MGLVCVPVYRPTGQLDTPISLYQRKGRLCVAYSKETEHGGILLTARTAIPYNVTRQAGGQHPFGTDWTEWDAMSRTAVQDRTDFREDTTEPEPLPFRWRRDEYERAASLGLFEAHRRLELIDGEVLEYVSPVGSQHAAAMSLAVYALTAAFGQRLLVRFEQPLVMSDLTELQPDITFVPPREDYYAGGHPLANEAMLVIEVSDTTLAFDRSRKATVYSDAMIPDYWIINLPASRLEVHRDPEPGYGYRTRITLSGADIVRPLCAPEIAIVAGALVPTTGKPAAS